MKIKSLVILVVLAVVLVAAVILSSHKQEVAPPSVVGYLVFPDLPVNDVAKVVVTSETSAVTLIRQNDTWGVAEMYNYPASFSKIRSLLLRLAEMKVGQVVTLAEGQRPGLKMVVPGASRTTATGGVEKAEGGVASGTSGLLINLYGGDGGRLAELLVGATHLRKPREEAPYFGSYPDGTFISPDGGKTVYLVKDLLDEFTSNARDWLDTEIINLSPGDIQEITISKPGQEEIRIVRESPGGPLVVQGLATNEEPDVVKLSSVENALSYLRFDDLADPALTDEEVGMTTAVVFTAVTSSGAVYTARIGGVPPSGQGRYLRLEAGVRAEEPKPTQPAEESGSVQSQADANASTLAEAASNESAAATNAISAAQASAEARRQLEAAVAAVNRRVKGWTYVIAAYKAEGMAVERAALVKTKPADERREESEVKRGEEKADSADSAE